MGTIEVDDATLAIIDAVVARTGETRAEVIARAIREDWKNNPPPTE